MKTNFRYGFTIIEVLVSVVIISVVVLSIVKIQQNSQDMALYIDDRSKAELSNTLFLGSKVEKYNKDKKSAFDLLSDEFKIQDDASREILKKIEKEIRISEPLKLEDDDLPVELREILLKDNYPAKYLHFKMAQ